MKDIRPCDVTHVKAKYLYYGPVDYFQGSDAEEVISIYAPEGTTNAQVLDALIAEFHNSSGWFDNVAGSGGLVEAALNDLMKNLVRPGKADEKCAFAEYADYDFQLFIGLYAHHIPC